MSVAAVDLLADAMDYFHRGWSVIPINTSSKKPPIKWGPYETRRPIEAEVRQWFTPSKSRKYGNGVAVITGAVSGNLAVRDFDKPSSYEQWAATNPSLARELPTVRTKRGTHVYHRSDLQKTLKLDDGEYRAGPTVTVAPHSVRRTSAGLIQYEWLNCLPKGELPLIEHPVFTGGVVAECAECHFSDYSAYSALSATCTPDEVIAVTLPEMEAQRNTRLLSLARGLKFNCGLAGADVGVVRGHVRRWHEQALPVISTKDFDTSWADFNHAWDRARYPLGANPVDTAALSLEPSDLPEIANQYDAEVTRRLVALCAALAAMNKGRFFLGSHDLAKRLGIDSMQAWRLMRMLCRDGVIECLDRGHQYRAARYRWIGGPSR